MMVRKERDRTSRLSGPIAIANKSLRKALLEEIDDFATRCSSTSPDIANTRAQKTTILRHDLSFNGAYEVRNAFQSEAVVTQRKKPEDRMTRRWGVIDNASKREDGQTQWRDNISPSLTDSKLGSQKERSYERKSEIRES